METATILADPPSGALENIISTLRKRVSGFFTLLFSVLMLFMLFMAWANRSEAVWTAEDGWGYAFGIVGGVLMLLLLIYPLRKRWRAMSGWLSVKFWFRLHMIFGVLGPVLIMMHSSYKLGSMNGRVAFFTMLIVAISGLFGRYFYQKLHYGLYGKKATFKSLRADSKELNNKFGPLFKLAPKTKGLLREYEERALDMPEGPISSAIHWVSMRLAAARVYRVVIRSLNKKLLAAGQLKGWSRAKVRRRQQSMRRQFIAHRKLLRQIQEYQFYERLFALWHLLHLPLFILMVVTAFVHVYAVHAY